MNYTGKEGNWGKGKRTFLVDVEAHGDIWKQEKAKFPQGMASPTNG